MLTRTELSKGLPVGFIGRSLYFYESLGSTNDEAKRLANQGALEGTLIVAHEQTAGRGRGDNSWVSVPGSSLSFSIILRPEHIPENELVGLSMLGALGVAKSLSEFDLSTSVKWPNDVLLDGLKVAGVLVEASWIGNSLEWAVLGIGINAIKEDLPASETFSFPATSVEDSIGEQLDLNALLLSVLGQVHRWYPELGKDKLREAWQSKLAFIGLPVEFIQPQGLHTGILRGISTQGKLILETPTQEIYEVSAGAGQLRPVDSDGG